MDGYDILECDRRPTPFGTALRVRVHRVDMGVMSLVELARVVHAAYPGRWVLQCFPPEAHFIDQANKYHLFVFDRPLRELDLVYDAPPGTTPAAPG